MEFLIFGERKSIAHIRPAYFGTQNIMCHFGYIWGTMALWAMWGLYLGCPCPGEPKYMLFLEKKFHQNLRRIFAVLHFGH